MKKNRIEELIVIHRDGLLKDTIPFWMKHTIDHEHGGFLNYLDQDGTILNTDKPVWVLGRFTWLMALLYNSVEKRPEWLNTSRHGIEFLEKYCFDTDGRMFFEVTRDGRPLRKRRYIYAETFGVIAFAEYSLAAGDEKKLERAKKLYKLLIRYYQNPELLPPKIYPQTRQVKSHAMPMILLATTQQIRKTGDDPLYEEVIDNSLKEVLEDFMHYDERALFETVGVNGERLDSPEGRCINPGHAIETSWFIMEEGRHRNDKNLIEKGCTILDWSLDWGWDKEYGGILYFVDVEGKPCEQYEHDMKLWWPHNEALYACLLAHYLTGQKKYEDWHEKIHEWAYSHFPDRKNGEWFKYLHRDGTISSTVKGNRWAGPFHLPRMQLYCWKLLEEMKKEI
ncbi:MAG: AGE family epimerase/isomerase [Kiritimatiellae bacterium]|nr:AGE family epimerase/isomerase [Verrucomicrobiota bacterium]MBU4366777.1 AGE family epimerase/isomerase [Verrucomicrobiota bacterium]MCG2659077.1 AGE family epimerase/isomerase [Kiritimatiellia bacterium]